MEEASSRNLGTTLKVPSVHELAKQELATIPSRYIRDDLEKTSSSILLPQVPVLRMDEKEMRDLFNDGMQIIRMNYSPPCPEPENTIGISPHSDADALTILLQLNETEGLQVRKDVPSVQELAEQHLTNIPARYLRPEQESPVISAGATVPVIDLQKLISGDSMDSELQKLPLCLPTMGFLQTSNGRKEETMATRRQL
ncbi:hypothetical protein RDI58_004949 [Solanum bulbocastanum]|uniref:Isopenicillin N synthase-like Fe(2+) 2OG dioxygenase domain-containing protein n=1 Tax=Solanum bulbocastanum TaxID=147425 RepID=A0AAN8YM38_SOLBU